MYRWTIETQSLPLRFTWKIARGESQQKTLYFIKVTDGTYEAYGEVAGVTGPSSQTQNLLQEFENFKENSFDQLDDILQLQLSPPLEFGITSAFTHLQALRENVSLPDFLNSTPSSCIETSFSLPILPIREIEVFFNKLDLSRFKVLKLKVSNFEAKEACFELARLFKGPLRVDANEAFKTSQECLEFFDSIKSLNIEFVEEPLPRGSEAYYKELKMKTPIPVFADESVQRDLFDESIKEQFHGVNIKLMKAGSYQKALKQIKIANKLGLKTMLGCMVESSLGIAGAMAISQDVDYFDLDGFLYFKNEPHRLVIENQGLLTYEQHPLFLSE